MIPLITRAAYPIKRAWSGNEALSRADMSRYASCKSVVTLKLAGPPRHSSRFASRCNSAYKVLNSASFATLLPFSLASFDELDSTQNPLTQTCRETLMKVRCQTMERPLRSKSVGFPGYCRLIPERVKAGFVFIAG